MIKRLLILLSFLLVSPAYAHVDAALDDYFASLKDSPHALTAFLEDMPKGGELHMHFFGSGYAEPAIAYARHPELCIEHDDYSIYIDYDCPTGSQLMYAANNTDLYNNLIDAWSMRNFTPGEHESHEHFFNAFDKFFWVKEYYRTEMLVEIMRRAAEQNILYLELMTTMNADKIVALANTAGIEPEDDFLTQMHKLYAAGIISLVQEISALTEHFMQLAHNNLYCEDDNPEAACDLTLRYKYLGLRAHEPYEVFALLLAGFELAQLDKHFVGVDIAQPEYDPDALADYDTHMAQFNFLKQQFPPVSVSLHAGELTADLVDPEHLEDHIEKAITIGQASRIGHGVAIRHERNQIALLEYMASQGIAAEINLTSNDEIMGVKGADSPFSVYFAHQVPIVLSTDDEGILRTTLSQEYERAATEQQASYSMLKNFSRNSLEYSFLAGASLWLDYQTLLPVDVCAEDGQLPSNPSEACLAFLGDHDKAGVQWTLEQRFIDFEAPYLNKQL